MPYESTARVLTQSKRTFSGYAVRQGLALAMEHNFMISAAELENFKNQLKQLVGSDGQTRRLGRVTAGKFLPPHNTAGMEEGGGVIRVPPQLRAVCPSGVDLAPGIRTRGARFMMSDLTGMP